ncbi:MAG TPA: hypothetical protein VI732_01525 [Alphaproteobacteria bacterium]|nr:hypothetical protein [Alphaproteobacteria bacterium]
MIFGSALLLRYGLFQSRTIGAICLDSARPVWCDARDAIAIIHAYWIWGWAGVSAGALGFWSGWRWALMLGLVASIIGLAVYNTELGAIGLILTLLGLARA